MKILIFHLGWTLFLFEIKSRTVSFSVLTIFFHVKSLVVSSEGLFNKQFIFNFHYLLFNDDFCKNLSLYSNCLSPRLVHFGTLLSSVEFRGARVTTWYFLSRTEKLMTLSRFGELNTNQKFLLYISKVRYTWWRWVSVIEVGSNEVIIRSILSNNIYSGWLGTAKEEFQ